MSEERNKCLVFSKKVGYILTNTPVTPMGRKVYAHLWRVSDFREARHEI